MKQKVISRFAIYFLILLGFGLVNFVFLKGQRLTPYGDGGLTCFRYVQNIQRFVSLDFHDWNNALIFFPNPYTFAYTDHFYLHSILGLPYYLLTQDPLETYDFVFFLQLVIAITGFYMIATKISASLPAIIICGLYFVYLPAFLSRHPHVNFYGFLAWFVYFVVQFFQSKKARYLYLSTLAFLLQALVSVYLQLFIGFFGLLFIVVFLADGMKKKKLREYLGLAYAVHLTLIIALLAAILFLVNRPYLDLRQNVDIHLNIRELRFYSADAMLSFLIPNVTGDLFRSFFPSLIERNLPFEKMLFLGVSGIFVIFLSVLCLVVIAIRKNSIRFNTKTDCLLLCMLFLFLMWIFSLGPYLQINNTSTDVKLPFYYLYNSSFIFGSIRCPARIVVFFSLPIALLLLWWQEELRTRSGPFGRCIVLMIFALVTFFDVFDRKDPTDSKYVYEYSYVYSYMNQIPGTTLLELPSGLTCGSLRGRSEQCTPSDDGYYMFMHIYHQKWTVNGYGRMVPPSTRRLMRSMDQYFDRRLVIHKIMKETGISGILIHKYRIQNGYENNYRMFLTALRPIGKTIYEDDKFIVVAINNSRRL